MPKFTNVDVIACLEQILNKNTVFFQNDFTYDKERIAECAASNNPDDKKMVWMSRFSGTWCFRERDVFLKDTSAHNTILYYENISSQYVLTYAVELIGIEEGVIKGNIYTLDYPKYCKKVHKKEMKTEIITYVFENGEIDDIATKFTQSFIAKHSGMGEFRFYRESPKDLNALQLLIKQEYDSRKRMREGNFNKYVVGLKQRIKE